MKNSKIQTTLNEKDALCDLLFLEKSLLSAYATALKEGGGVAFRKEILKHYACAAETQFTLFEEMLSRGYYTVSPAPEKLKEEAVKRFLKSGKELKE